MPAMWAATPAAPSDPLRQCHNADTGVLSKTRFLSSRAQFKICTRFLHDKATKDQTNNEQTNKKQIMTSNNNNQTTSKLKSEAVVRVA
jgi:hypothetical protein